MSRGRARDMLIAGPDGPKQSVVENERQLTTLCNVVNSCLFVVAIVLMAVLLKRATPAPLPAPCPEISASMTLVADNVTCGMSNDCQQGFLSADNSSCLVLPRPTNHTCQWACAPSEEPLGTCNALGECVGNQSVCPGTCFEDHGCPDTFFNTDVFSVYDPETFWTFSSWYNPMGCRYGTCVYALLDIYVVSSEFPIFQEDEEELVKGWWPGASRFKCLDYVNPEIVNNRSECIRYERFLLSPDMVSYPSYSDYGNGTLPYQLSLCVMSWACSKPHVFASGVDGIDNIPVKTLAQRGFTPIASSRKVAGVSNDDALLGISNPSLRNSMMAYIEEKTKEALPAFLELIASRALPPSPS